MLPLESHNCLRTRWPAHAARCETGSPWESDATLRVQRLHVLSSGGIKVTGLNVERATNAEALAEPLRSRGLEQNRLWWLKQGAARSASAKEAKLTRRPLRMTGPGP